MKNIVQQRFILRYNTNCPLILSALLSEPIELFDSKIKIRQNARQARNKAKFLKPVTISTVVGCLKRPANDKALI